VKGLGQVDGGEGRRGEEVEEGSGSVGRGRERRRANEKGEG
jgi:hypothetical protein